MNIFLVFLLSGNIIASIGPLSHQTLEECDEDRIRLGMYVYGPLPPGSPYQIDNLEIKCGWFDKRPIIFNFKRNRSY